MHRDPKMKSVGKHPFQRSKKGLRFGGRMWSGLLAICTYSLLLCVAAIIGKITFEGLPVLFQSEAPFVNLEFFTESPTTLHEFTGPGGGVLRLDHTDYLRYLEENPGVVISDERSISHGGGGILGPLVGTILLIVLSMGFALVLGISTAIFMVEFARDSRLVQTLRLAIMNLAGVPSIVFGLFGFAFFCMSPVFPVLTPEPDPEKSILAIPVWLTDGYLSFQGWGSSLIAGAATLAIMVLPVIVAACEESLKAVPRSLREASLALGASRWTCIRTAVLPHAAPGMLTASVLGVTRVAGETAPILFTAAVLSRATLPWEEVEGSGLFWVSNVLTQKVEALPYHIYTVSRQPGGEALNEMRYGSVLFFLILVMGFAMVSVVLRSRYRRRNEW